jgi:glycosyltransferase involved in cell wall biosynthesis
VIINWDTKVWIYCKAGKSGQFMSASKQATRLKARGQDVQIVTINLNSIADRLNLIFKILFDKCYFQNNSVIHLGLEVLPALILRSYSRQIFVNHGIYMFPHKRNFIRFMYIFALKLAILRGNYIGSVNPRQCRAFGGKFHFQNEAENVCNVMQKGVSNLEKTVCGISGGYNGQKNLKVLLRAIRDTPHIKFIHLGRSKIKQFEQFENYFYAGNDPKKFYPEIDLLAIPSRYESFCLIAYEASAYGIPVVSSGLDALSELPFPNHVVANNETDWFEFFNSDDFFEISQKRIFYSQDSHEYDKYIYMDRIK